MKHRILTILFTAVLTAGMLSGCQSSTKEADTAQTETQEETDTDGFSDGSESEDATVVEEDDAEVVEENVPIDESTETADTVVLDTSTQLTGIHHAEIEVQDYGTIELELDADTAPISVTNFVKLAQEGFYDGLTFHRIMDGFMIQGGDPEANGTGGSDETIKGEFEENGVTNDISHVRGTISMARASDYDSASSQFFIVQTDSTYLDGQYAGFGTVTSGMDIVDQICKDVESDPDTGLVADKEDQPVIETIRILD